MGNFLKIIFVHIWIMGNVFLGTTIKKYMISYGILVYKYKIPTCLGPGAQAARHPMAALGLPNAV